MTSNFNLQPNHQKVAIAFVIVAYLAIMIFTHIG